MIYVNIRGGLGNQIAQYIAARNLAIRLNTGVCLDISFYKNIDSQTTQRDFLLNGFNIQAEFMSDALAGKVRRSRTFLNKVINHFSKDKIIVINEDDANAQAIFQNPIDNIYLRGYWHRHEYFSKVKQDIIGDFNLSYELGDEQSKLLKMVSKSNSVSIHIRRGDYLNLLNKSRYGACDEYYYSEAMKHIEKETEDPTYFIFSDDVAWCRENISSQNKIKYVSLGEGSHTTFEIFLMSRCRHNIIANSSFSLYGAMLNINENNIVIAPTPWFNVEKEAEEQRLGKDWVRLKRNI